MTGRNRTDGMLVTRESEDGGIRGRADRARAKVLETVATRRAETSNGRRASIFENVGVYTDISL